MEGYILVLSILVLSGVIATVGDRLGTRVGKARLSLFGLRPRNTAVVITIMTGGVISATTLGLLFAINDGLRDIFNIEEFRRQQEEAEQALATANQEKEKVETQLELSRQQQIIAQEELAQTNQFLQEAKERQDLTEAQLQGVESRAEKLRGDVEGLQQEQSALIEQQGNLIAQRDRVQAQIIERDQEIIEQDQEIIEQDQEIIEQDQEIQAQEQIIRQGEGRLAELETAQAFLQEEVQNLEREFTEILTGEVALTRGQILNQRLIRVPSIDATDAVVDQLLREANRFAVRKLRSSSADPNEPLIQITPGEVNRLMDQIQDGRTYVVRVLSAANYVFGEGDRVQVFVDVAPNQVIFNPGELIARTSTDITTMDRQQIQERLNLLIAASQFRAERKGIVSDNVEVQALAFVGFLEQVANYPNPLTIQAVALEPIYTLGPLRLRFIALDNDQEVFRSAEQIVRDPRF